MLGANWAEAFIDLHAIKSEKNSIFTHSGLHEWLKICLTTNFKVGYDIDSYT